MSTTLERPPAAPSPAPPGARRRSAGYREDWLMIATLALLVTACVPLARVYVGLAFFRPVIGAVLLSVGLAWGARRLGAGPLTTLAISFAGWIAFVSAAFLSESLFAGVLPTTETIGAAGRLFGRGWQLMQLRPAPAFAEAGMIFITVSAIWAITLAVEILVFRLAAPIPAIVVALALWTVPLFLAPPTTRPWAWAVPFLAAAALLLLAFAGADLKRWGAWAPGTRGGQQVEPSLLPTGGVLAILAIVAGSLLAGAVPGFGKKPWYELRGTGGTTLTTNPIVDIRSRLVAEGDTPVMRVQTERPVYLRTTALDVYSEGEEWTNRGIRGAPIDGDFPLEVPLGPVERVRLEVEVQDLPKAVLIPTPYQALSVAGPIADAFQYDRTNSTVTLDEGRTLKRGDRYAIVAAVPSPTVEQLETASVAADPVLTQLPSNVPDKVRNLARQIVERENADTAFDKALAIQNELRSWRYSTTPPQGHGGQAMLAFVNNRVGYCEQYAGTMAVMLRTLGVPARVAVGFTPGDLVDRDSNAYAVTNSHAHAWVEVLYEGLGWVAFEPTPRSDGNVLVPTATNVAPSRTAAQTANQADDGTPGGQDFDQAGPNEDFPNRQQLEDGDSAEPTEPPADQGRGGRRGAGRGGRGGGRTPWVLLAALLGTALAAAAVASRRGSVELPGRPPLERVLHARAQVEHVARGMGMSPAPWETDAEYLGRVAHRHGATARTAAAALAMRTARGRYAPELDEADAVEAEQASERLQGEMLRDTSALRSGVIRLRGRLSAAAGRVRVSLPRRSARRG